MKPTIGYGTKIMILFYASILNFCLSVTCELTMVAKVMKYVSEQTLSKSMFSLQNVMA
jgi:hypothetical protein